MWILLQYMVCGSNFKNLKVHALSRKYSHLNIDSFVEKVALRGHLGVPDTVFEPLIVPLNYLVTPLECLQTNSVMAG